jgi:hypothetical protein
MADPRSQPSLAKKDASSALKGDRNRVGRQQGDLRLDVDHRVWVNGEPIMLSNGGKNDRGFDQSERAANADPLSAAEWVISKFWEAFR